MLAGLGIGHAVWGQNAAAPVSSSGGSSGSTGSSGSGGLGSGGLGGFGSGGFGSGGLGSGGTGGFGSGGSGSSGSSTPVPAADAAVAQKVDPTLVDINTTLSYQQAAAAGTGIVLSSSGLVLTNNHVINGATAISATDIGNGQTYTAVVVGYDRTQDVAILQLQGASNLRAASLGDSKSIKTGQSIIAIGNAGGVGGSPSVVGGNVTALDRNITASDDNGADSEQLSGLVQVNADIQPGDSGGPLLNQSGQVVGMDTAASDGLTFQQTSSTQGFAIPIDTALNIGHQIEARQTSSTIHIGQTGFIGVQVESPSDAQNPSYGLEVGQAACTNLQGVSSGATVVQVVSGSPAGSAGLQSCDTIVAVNGTTVASPTALTTALLNYHPGDTIKLSYINSSGAQQTANVHLNNGPAQ
jgi:S1-C subfamily serine protease